MEGEGLYCVITTGITIIIVTVLVSHHGLEVIRMIGG